MEPNVAIEPVPSHRLLVISPHLDDGVFACGRLLSAAVDAIVATVFAGWPDAGAPLTEWDRAAGFRPGDDVLVARRNEDAKALEILDARPIWLDFRDAQYGGGAHAAEVADRLEREVEHYQPLGIVLPLGLFHSDHRLCHEAGMTLLRRRPRLDWLLYEDAFYRALPCLRDDKLAQLRRDGFALDPLRFAVRAEDRERKRAAVACYGSQLKALSTKGRPGLGDLESEEAYWRIGIETEGGR